jgi:hypothetical protein
MEFLENFDNAEIQAQIRAEIVSVKQLATQPLTEFVLVKNQLARRVNTGLSESQTVGIIAGLMRDEFRIHVRLQRPETFGDLRRIAGVLDPQTFTTCPRAQDRVPPEPRNKGCWKNRDPTQPPNRRGKPPGPCRICGGTTGTTHVLTNRRFRETTEETGELVRPSASNHFSKKSQPSLRTAPSSDIGIIYGDIVNRCPTGKSGLKGPMISERPSSKNFLFLYLFFSFWYCSACSVRSYICYTAINYYSVFV